MVKGEGLPITIQTNACIYCGKSSLVQMTRVDYMWFNSGLMAQEALPKWTADQRELLISGTHPECWAHMFSELDEDDEAV
jgi:hypothetical protein